MTPPAGKATLEPDTVRARPVTAARPSAGIRCEGVARRPFRFWCNCPIAELPPQPAFAGAGAYAIHYEGPFTAYAGLEAPIYVGKADKSPHGRLVEHAASIDAACNIDLGDFGCRWLVLEPVWIALTEQILIDRHHPIWNRIIKGFGNHDQGGTRKNQRRSQWDTVHPGRNWAKSMQLRPESAEGLLQLIAEHLAAGSSLWTETARQKGPNWCEREHRESLPHGLLQAPRS